MESSGRTSRRHRVELIWQYKPTGLNYSMVLSIAILIKLLLLSIFTNALSAKYRMIVKDPIGTFGTVKYGSGPPIHSNCLIGHVHGWVWKVAEAYPSGHRNLTPNPYRTHICTSTHWSTLTCNPKGQNVSCNVSESFVLLVLYPASSHVLSISIAVTK
ncbi:hypothetical protein BU24DRAFT_426567 [Aaosphaeria arxii CBS 175.79]|uniref:Uncharacterized protein n=1 Tax=Aaosphaeria arxii CBS 175.79 TaxID=1450172 RepID=A0A6A5XEY3_9PLEO|nr:uncharacterized protein BU24DRAFT_426567 [Aaosphaeria arxii CBS 175.79]KAF2011480.1 hypothetical protein BU24DRAFT_426567 [Aaosphaeria arxii CBS 175.79]